MSLKKGDQSNDIKKALFDELIKKFQKCHDIIWEGGKRDPTTAFDEFSKLLMAKMYDEIRTLMGEEYSFQWKINDTTRDIVKRIKELYAQVRKLNSKVFKEELGLPENIIAEIVKIIQAISLIETDLDTKGRAFEQFLGKVFRDDYGQYFTPRTVVKFMVEVLEPTKADIIMDPACGSGGFLLNSLLYMIEDQLNHYSEESKFRNFVHQLSGIEINDRVARIAMLDLVIHGGTFNSIECNNALLSYQELGKTQEIEPNKYSLILTNPPFGAVVRDNRILRNYTLGEGRENQKTEILFIERCLDLLRPGGRLGIVLPDSVLTNSSLQYVREFILERTKLLAIISLPHHTFVPSGAGVKSSLLFMNKIDFDEKKPLMYFLKKMDQKKEEFNANKDYPVFMAVAKHIGYDARGEEDINDLLGILNDWKKYISESPLELKKSFVVKNSQLKNNFSADKFVFYSAYRIGLRACPRGFGVRDEHR
ncbi:MAG: class I SAM-dependent DNA methyltransferase, partial [Candidatus Hodarchaeota archaeon]